MSLLQKGKPSQLSCLWGSQPLSPPTEGQSEQSSDSNKLTLCSPIRPAQHIGLVMHQWSEAEIQAFQSGDAWETGQDLLTTGFAPWPCLGCVVVWYHTEWQEPAYQVYSGLLFGLLWAIGNPEKCAIAVGICAF